MEPVQKTKSRTIFFRMARKVYYSRFYQNLRKRVIKKRMLTYLRKEILQDKDEYEKMYLFLKKNPLSVYAYDFTKKYKPDNIQVFTDNECDMKYVFHENKRLYFHPGWTKIQIKKYYNMLSTEQDMESPHRYEYERFKVEDGDVVVDIGVAEGNFALSVVERASKVYLFESDQHWIFALKKTFEPWRDKVVIVNKCVTSKHTDNEVRLDDYFEHSEVNFIKIDVDGAEMQVLQGAKNVLSNQQRLNIAICTYHKQHDADDIGYLLKSCQYQLSFSKGYAICFWDRKAAFPWLRRGLIRAVKNIQC